MAYFASAVLLMVLCHICGGKEHQYGAPASHSVTNGTELLMTFLVHRHGDRTPVPHMKKYFDNSAKENLITVTNVHRHGDKTPVKYFDAAAMEDLIAPWGYGQLTDTGRRRGYELGKFIRARYGDFLSDKYNKSEIYLRSTDSDRTKMTLLAAMAAVYPASTSNWNPDINWSPVPYTTVPVKYDFNMAWLNCPKFLATYKKLLQVPICVTSRCTKALAKLSRILGYKVVTAEVVSDLHDLFISVQNLGGELGEQITSLLPALEEAAYRAIDITFGHDDLMGFQAGVLLNEFFNSAKNIAFKNKGPRVRIYSAHDFNVYSLAAVSQIIPRQGVPKFGSAFALEFRRVTSTGRYVVLPVYVASPGEPVKYLQVAGCDEILCDIDQFYERTNKYLLTEDQWRAKCGYTEDTVVESGMTD